VRTQFTRLSATFALAPGEIVFTYAKPAFWHRSVLDIALFAVWTMGSTFALPEAFSSSRILSPRYLQLIFSPTCTLLFYTAVPFLSMKSIDALTVALSQLTACADELLDWHFQSNHRFYLSSGCVMWPTVLESTELDARANRTNDNFTYFFRRLRMLVGQLAMRMFYILAPLWCRGKSETEKKSPQV